MWHSGSLLAGTARLLLAPAAAAYRAVTSARNALYDRGALAVARPSIPVVSIGNLTVGGTGKTPVAAWMVRQLELRGARPSIVLRGYGSDEPMVHAVLNPDARVFANADRVAAVQEAASAGCDVAVLDDAFQHRRIARTEDVVLVSADQWQEPMRLLPAGPWREAPSALSRASCVIVTRKAVADDVALSLRHRLAALTKTGDGAVMTLELDALHDAVTGAIQSLSSLGGARVLAVAGLGDPQSFARQLGGAGAQVELRSYSDHHPYDKTDIERLAREARSFDHICCTLKDAVKLGPRWPREAPPLWYVSLRCGIEVGEAEVSALLDRVLAARPRNDR
jgi:tetraacyldisaccharide 4'-kinase